MDSLLILLHSLNHLIQNMISLDLILLGQHMEVQRLDQLQLHKNIQQYLYMEILILEQVMEEQLDGKKDLQLQLNISYKMDILKLICMSLLGVQLIQTQHHKIVIVKHMLKQLEDLLKEFYHILKPIKLLLLDIQWVQHQLELLLLEELIKNHLLRHLMLDQLLVVLLLVSLDQLVLIMDQLIVLMQQDYQHVVLIMDSLHHQLCQQNLIKYNIEKEVKYIHFGHLMTILLNIIVQLVEKIHVLYQEVINHFKVVDILILMQETSLEQKYLISQKNYDYYINFNYMVNESFYSHKGGVVLKIYCQKRVCKKREQDNQIIQLCNQGTIIVKVHHKQMGMDVAELQIINLLIAFQLQLLLIWLHPPTQTHHKHPYIQCQFLSYLDFLKVKLINKGTCVEIAQTRSSDEETIVKKRQLSPIRPFEVHESFWRLPKEEIIPTLPLETLFKTPPPEEPVHHNETFEKLEIVTNTNQKILIDVPQRPAGYTLEKLNFKGKPNIKEFFAGLPNPMDYEERNKNFKAGGYKLNYQSGYAPVEIQNKHKDPEDFTKKQHFIRTKQSQANLNLKRTCGVSYVKKSESEQKDVNHIYKKLSPLVYQCSSGCSPVSGFDDALDNLFINLLNGKNLIVFTLFQAQDESVLREYLLNSSQRNKLARERVMIARKFYDLWMLFQDALALVIHLNYDEQHLLRTIQLNEEDNVKQQLVDFITESDIQICLLFKKSVSGRKAFLKSVGLWNETSDNLSVNTETHQEEISTKFVIQVPRIQIDENATAQSLFQQFTNIIQQDFVLQQKEQKEQQEQKILTSSATKSKAKKRARILSSTDVKKDAGASEKLIEYLVKEDGNHNINTCSIRMEMYAREEKWKKSNDHNKNLLNAFIKRVEQHITATYLIKMMNKRFKANEKGLDYIIKRSSKIQEISAEGLLGNTETENIDWTCKFESENFSKLQTQKLQKKYKPISLEIMKMKELNFLKQPLYCITTRDSFAFDLITKTTKVKLGERLVDRLDFYFEPNNCPQNFKAFLPMFPEYQVGAHAFVGYFTNEELLQMEKDIYEMELKGFDGHYLPMTAQVSHAQSNHHASVRRTKFFFGYRYMWTKCQLAEPHSMVAAGIRRDVSHQPLWMKNLINKLENDTIVPKDFINSIACNVYHDGKEGLAQHFDDAVRFRQPIYTIRVFSDCRLSFGSQFYGFCNGAFAVPLPRGCILCMEEGSYAANAIKHCVRPCDMTGKSAALILRQMHEQVTQEAIKYDEQVDLPCHFSTLSIQENAVPFGEQKRLEAELLI